MMIRMSFLKALLVMMVYERIIYNLVNNIQLRRGLWDYREPLSALVVRI